jgi:hypothetical protein
VKALCGGTDSVDIAAEDGTAFQLSIEYPNRSDAGGTYHYGVRPVVGSRSPRISLYYNRFSMQADHATYDTATHTVTGTGSVDVDQGYGRVQHQERASFHLTDGKATSLD